MQKQQKNENRRSSSLSPLNPIPFTTSSFVILYRLLPLSTLLSPLPSPLSLKPQSKQSKQQARQGTQDKQRADRASKQSKQGKQGKHGKHYKQSKQSKQSTQLLPGRITTDHTKRIWIHKSQAKPHMSTQNTHVDLQASSENASERIGNTLGSTGGI